MLYKILFAIGFLLLFMVVITVVCTASLVGFDFVYNWLFPQPSHMPVLYKIISIISFSLISFLVFICTTSALFLGFNHFYARLFPLPSQLTLIELTEKSFLKQHLRKMIRDLEELGFSLDKYYLAKHYHFFLANLVKDDEAISAVVYGHINNGEVYVPNDYWMELTLYLADGTRAIVSNAPSLINDIQRPVPPFKRIKYKDNKTTAVELLEIMREMAEIISIPLIRQISFKDQYEADATREIAWLVETYGDTPKARQRRKMFADYGGL